MSSMLEQAIVDAQALREAALKSAEGAVIQKYSEEVRGAVDKILEQDLDDDFMGDDPLDMGDDALGLDGDAEVSVDLPAAHDPDLGEDEVVVIDLDQIIAAADAEEGDEETFELDAEEIADEIGVTGNDDLDDEGMMANRDDEEVDLNESDLLDMFKEMLVIDVDQEDIDAAEKMSEEEEDEESLERVVSSPREDGMDKDAVEAHNAHLSQQLESLTHENKELKNILVKVKDRLEEINQSNARLLYANRVLKDSSLNEQQKNKIAEMVSEARTVEEAKMVYETLQKTLAGNPRRNTAQSLSEVVSRKSSVILSGHRKVEDSDEAPVKNRWATLAGINKN